MEVYNGQENYEARRKNQTRASQVQRSKVAGKAKRRSSSLRGLIPVVLLVAQDRASRQCSSTSLALADSMMKNRYSDQVLRLVR